MKYFTDSLVQIAILLSLLRTDLDSYLNSLVNNNNDIQEIIFGPLSGLTQTNSHGSVWQNGLQGGYSHPKSVDNAFYASSVFRELYALGRDHRFESAATDIHAYLVSHPEPLQLHNDGHGASATTTTDDANNNVHPGSDNHSGQTGNDRTNSDPEGAHGSSNLEIPSPSSEENVELSSEDMDLIDVLWRQDIDLGVSRDMYDLNLRKELEKEREQELLKQRQKEQDLKDAANLESQQQQQQRLDQYVVDGETGELVPLPPDKVNGNRQQVSEHVPLTSQEHSPLDGEEGLSIEEAMRILEGSVDQSIPDMVQPNPVQSTIVQPHHVPSTVRQLQPLQTTMVQPRPTQHTGVQPSSMVGSMQPTIVQPTSMQPTIVQPTSMQPTIVQPTSMQSTIVQPTSMQSTIVQPTSMQPTIVQPTSMQPTIVQPTLMQPTIVQPTSMQPTNNQMNHTQLPDTSVNHIIVQQAQDPGQRASYIRQSSIEQRWQDVSSLFCHTLPQGLASNSSGVDLPAQNIPPGALMNNASMVPTNSSLSFLQELTSPAMPMNMTMGLAADPAGSSNDNETGSQDVYASHTNNDNQTGSPDVYSGHTNNDNQTGSQDIYASHTNSSFFNMDSPEMLFPGIAPNFGHNLNTSMNNTENLLQHLLNSHIADLDLSDLNISEGAQPMQVDDASSDSAVSSLAPSISPAFTNATSLQDDHHSDTTTPFEGLEGATGGSRSQSLSSRPKHEKYDPDYSYAEFGYDSNDDEHSNSSLSSNDTDFNYHSATANPRHISHNHSYPLQPGQEPKERKCDKELDKFRIICSRDEKKAKQIKLPFTASEIVHCSVERFNDMMTKYKLTEVQLQLIRDIRRRGKNKVAAQNCRKRKLEIIVTLEEEVQKLRDEKVRLERERRSVERDKMQMHDKYGQQYNEVFQSLRDEHGDPYDPNQYTLEHTADGNVFLVPLNSTSAATATATSPPSDDPKPKNTRKRKSRKD